MDTMHIEKMIRVATGLLFVALQLFHGQSGMADQPVVYRIAPIGYERGQEVQMTLHGDRLTDALKLLFYQPGIELLEMTAQPDGKLATARLRITQDCRPGLHSMRLATRSGISNLRYFGVGALPIVDEVEPNSEFATPQPIPMNVTVHGLCTNEDVDYYQVELAEGQTLTVELEGLRLGTEFFDPFVAILDENRFELARSDDHPLVQQDCVCSFTANTSGKYIVEVRESSFGGSGDSYYRVHIGDFPRPVVITPSGGRPGEKIQASVVDISGKVWNQTIELPAQTGDTAFVAEQEGKIAPSGNLLRVIDLPNYLEQPDDASNRASIAAVEPPAAFNGVLETPGDKDWFKIVGKKDQTIEVRVHGRQTLRSPIDSWLEICNASEGVLAAGDDDAGKPDSYLSYRFPEDGEYWISIRDQLQDGSPFHAYRIEVTSPRPGLHFTIDELQQYISQIVEVPRGGQMAVILRAQRANFGGPLQLQLLDAPAGVELLTPSVAADQSFIPLMIRAPKEAAVDAGLTNLVGQLVVEGQPDSGNQLSGGLIQRTMLVRGQNNIDVWGHDANRLALSITEELPFSIAVEQPQVPLTRNGSTEFVVRATRKEGYADPISLRVLYNPPGVSASGSISIAGDATEARIPVTANHQAAIGKFPITVLAHARGTDAGRWLASEFIQLEVQDSLFDFQFPKAVIAQGESGFVTVGITAKQPPEGEVEFELLGIPAGATTSTPKIAWTDQAPSINYPIVVAADARVGQHQTLVIQAVIKRPGGQIVQTQGTGELQIVPPPPKPAETVAVAAAPVPVAPSEPPAKPLSRLEQLRQAKQQGGG